MLNKPFDKKIVVAAVSLILMLSACSQPVNGDHQSDVETRGMSGENMVPSDTKVCMIAGLGGLDDRSFNQSSYEGLERARDELGVEINVAETFSDADYVPMIDNALNEECDLIIGISYMITAAMTDAAKENPDVNFALIDDLFPAKLPNVKGAVFDTGQASYLAGYAAAGMTSTGTVGTFLGGKMGPTMLFADGFHAGVDKYNEVHGANIQLVGWDRQTQEGIATGDFEDVAKGKQYALQLFEQDVDILLPVAGNVSIGALAAAHEKEGTSIIWVDVDGYYSEPDYADLILTSVTKGVDNAVFSMVEDQLAGEFGYPDYVGTLTNGGVGLAPWHHFEEQVPQGLKDEIEELRQQVVDGEIIVESPSTPKIASADPGNHRGK